MPPEKTDKLDTSDFAVDRYAPHGRVELRFDGDFLLYEVAGPVNVELINALASAQKAFLMTNHRLQPWVSIATLKNSAVAPLEAFERYEEIMRAPKPPGYIPIATAFVIAPEVEGGRLMLPRYKAIYAAINRPFASFATIAEANAWGQTMLDAAREGN